MTLPVNELIRKKRDGGSLTETELSSLIDGYVRGDIPDYQMAAFLMATYFRGMTESETLTFTQLMLHSGSTVDLSSIPGVKVDKHSTGGVGDKISLLLAPIVASCGVPVPMISGRGLGHTGGTLDKLESIPGFKTSLTIEEYRGVIADVGAVMIGQTNEIAPADKKMYALRDVTSTVECIPLIAGSIMSKKLAEGIDALVLDVKTGRGAFMQSYDRSLELAAALVKIGNSFGKETMAFITDMDQPLGSAIGNWTEVVESVECLRGKPVADIMELTLVLSGAMLLLGKRAGNLADAIRTCREAVESGRAYAKFKEIVRRQGGDVQFLDHPDRYPSPKHRIAVTAERSGFVTGIDALELGLVSIALGAGRGKVDDRVDPKAGILLKRKAGDHVGGGEAIAEILTDRTEALPDAAARVRAAFSIGDERPALRPLIHTVVDRSGVHPFTPVS